MDCEGGYAASFTKEEKEEGCNPTVLYETLAPEPISFAFPGRGPITVGESSQANRQRPKKSFLVETTHPILKLWKNEANEYILEIQELAKDITKYYKLNRCIVKDEPRIQVKETQLDNEVWTKVRDAEVNPVNKYGLALTERLGGPWVVQTSQRINDARTDTVYKHPKVKNLRSVKELATFIMYGKPF